MIATALAAATLAATALQPGTVQSFESLTALPPEWQVSQYVPDASTVGIKRGHAADGHQFVRIVSAEQNHTRLLIPTPVEANSSYKISVQVRARGPETVVAGVAVDGYGSLSDPVPGDDRWQERDLYLRNGKATQISVVLSLGWFGSLASGSADFDKLDVEKIDAVPFGAPAVGVPAPRTISTADVSKGLLPLAGLLVLLIAGCGGVLLRGERVD